MALHTSPGGRGRGPSRSDGRVRGYALAAVPEPSSSHAFGAGASFSLREKER
jgi:hypothetical protein